MKEKTHKTRCRRFGVGDFVFLPLLASKAQHTPRVAGVATPVCPGAAVEAVTPLGLGLLLGGKVRRV